MKSIITTYLLNGIISDTVAFAGRYEKESNTPLTLYDYVSVFRHTLNKSILSKLENTTPVLYNTSEYKFISNPEDVLFSNGLPHDLRQSRGTYLEKYYQALADMLLTTFPEFLEAKIARESLNDLDTTGLSKLISEARNNKSMWEV